MSMIERSLDGMAALSSELGAILRRRLCELWRNSFYQSRHDGRAGARELVGARPVAQPRHRCAGANLLGWPGAVVADLMMQLLGLGALALILPIAAWGYRLLGHRSLGASGCAS